MTGFVPTALVALSLHDAELLCDHRIDMNRERDRAQHLAVEVAQEGTHPLDVAGQAGDRREALVGASATRAPGETSAATWAWISGQGSYSVSLEIDWLVRLPPDPSSPPDAASLVEAAAV